VRHPNSYLPKYNIQSETDGESIPLTHTEAMANKRMLKNGVDIGPHQIIQSDEEDDDVQAYGFPSQKRRNRVQQSDLELELSKGGELRKKNRWKNPFSRFIGFSLPHRSTLPS
jgi:protocadherin Fat 1/2/3